ncbi:Nramp family divalent metal transporter [Streptomyces sp. NBC_01565]|uniref:Nramp family divalent metal transporter n=1 Tax=unclassified Streptomyces TaxID=2593676 RepID=UPI00225253A5|nr:Nramp family divalent metal transporter [Streptomyces sp. NBC_01565]MCX4545677.1 Nramp family divalent metal transporter [Streptomyces sp. NBC_01565]
MADTTRTITEENENDRHPVKPGWRHIGPGIVVAATGVGAGDLVATLIAGGKFGYTLLWAAVIGCLVKISLAEAAGRWHLATGRTLFDGWRSLGSWTTVYFAGYVVVWGFVYGAAAMSSSALPLAALFPDTMDLKAWAVLCGLVGLVFVWFNRYAVFEKVMTVLVGVMFVVTVYLAVRVTPHLGAAFAGLAPVLPEGSLIYTLGLVGGVGGTITLAAYGYWINAKGWTDTGWMKVMRLDNRVAYVTTGVFVVAMLFVGAELLHSSGVAIAKGDRGLLDLTDILAERYGTATAKLFLVGFFATSFTSLIGVWHGVSLMFADFVTKYRPSLAPAGTSREKSLPFRAYLLWLTFPPISLLFLDQPFGLVIVYGVIGAFFMPFLALTLLWLLNSSRTPADWRNGVLSNVMLAAAGLLFVVLCVQQVRELPW